MSHYYNYSYLRVAEILNTDPVFGLNVEKIKKSREEYGSNKILNDNKVNFLSRIVKGFLHPFSFITIFCGIIGIYYAFYIQSIIIFLLLIFTEYFYLNEVLIEINKFNNLKKMNKIKAHCIREGKSTYIFSEDLVVGDIILIKEGDIIPADIRFMDCKGLIVEETAITGEYYEGEKFSAKLEERDLLPNEILNMGFKATSVVKGYGTGIVTNVGFHTEIGKNLNRIPVDKEKKDSFRKKIYTMVDVVCFFGLIVGIIFFNWFKEKSMLLTIIMSYAALQGIFVTEIIISLSKKILRRSDISINKYTVMKEILKVNSIIVDRLGILSKEKMDLFKIYTDNKIYNLNPNFNNGIYSVTDNINRLITAAILCNASIQSEQDRAIETLAKDLKINRTEILFSQKKVYEIPYDTRKRISASLYKVEDKYRVYVRGPVDKIIEKSNFIMKNGIEYEIKDEDIDKIKNADMELSTELLQTEAIAYRNFKYKPSTDENTGSNLVFIGILGFESPLYMDDEQAMYECKALGISPIIISEDGKLTSIALSNNLNMNISQEAIISGVEMDNMDELEYKRNILNINIYSRISTNNRLKIVQNLKALGYNIMMTGSKLINLPSMQNSNVSIASGEYCDKDISQSADIYMKDATFQKIINLIKTVVNMDACINYAVLYIFSIIGSELIYEGLALYKFNTIPFNIYQILYINSVLSTIVSLSIFFSHRFKGVIRFKKEIIKSVINSIAIASICLICFTFILNGFGIKEANIAGFVTFCVLSTILPINFKGLGRNFIKYIFFGLATIVPYIIYYYSLLLKSWSVILIMALSFLTLLVVTKNIR